MELNSDIVFDRLQEVVPAEIYGPADAGLHLKRPEFYLDDMRTLLANHLYVAKADRLPPRPVIERGAVIICIGDSLHFSYYRERCRIIRLKRDENLFSVFNLVQNIFNQSDTWNNRLNDILGTTASVKEMIECSRSVFENPMFVIDANFNFIAYSGYADPAPETKERFDWPLNDNDSLRLPALGQYLELREPAMNVKEPMLIDLLDSTSLNVNLFDNGEYIGCLTIDYRMRKHRSGDIALAQHLADMITLSLQKYSAVLSNEKSVLRKVLQDVVEGLPPDSDRRALDSAYPRREYVCIKMIFSNRFSQLPTGYVCNMLEHSFKESIAFEYDSAIIGFIETNPLKQLDGQYKDRLRDTLKTFIQSMDMRVGVSDAFEDLYNARLYYRQACAALENGNLLRFKERYYTFSDYALMEMVVNSLGELPVEMYYSEGLRRLAEHDAQNTQVSYLETLREYLNQNMGITKTAAALFIHRSTLLERLARIERELDTDLKDPDERLRLQILLKALQIHKTMRGKREP